MLNSCRFLLICLVLFGTCHSYTAQADTLTVSNLNDSGPGSLRDQVAAAAPGDTIDFAVTGTITLTSGTIDIAKNLTITGQGASSLALNGIDTDGRRSIFNISAGFVDISGLTLSGGRGNFYDVTVGGVNTSVRSGGALFISGGTVTVTNCTLSDNSANYGGAIFMTGGGLTVSNCTLSYNQAIYGGAIRLDGGAAVTIKSSTLTYNSGQFGGAIYTSTDDSEVTISSSALYFNQALATGGAILTNGGTLTISNSTLSQNFANGGSNGYGGGIYIGSSNGRTTITNSTITLNHARTYNYGAGGGIWGGPVNMSNSIVCGNLGNVPNVSNFTIITGTNNLIDQDAMLEYLADNGGPTQTHKPGTGSPAVDMGDPDFDTTNLPYDQRGPGFARVLGGRMDIGAFEAERHQSGSSIVVNTLDDHDDGAAGLSDCTLREAVKYAPAGAAITFSVTGTITLTSGDLAIAKNLTITGPSSAPGITVSGNNASRIFRITGGTVNLSWLTLTGGNSTSTSIPANTGGAIDNGGGTVHLSNSTLFGNSAATWGGAIRNFGSSTLTVTNSTISGNSAGTSGGAIRNGGILIVANSTISGNTVTGSTGTGGGIHIANGTAAFSNSIVAGNTSPTAPDIFGAIASANYNLIGKSDGSSGLTHGTNGNLVGTEAAPLDATLDALKSNGGPTQTLALLTGSPALNAGSNALIDSGVTTDQRGFARVDGGTVDIGAFELDVTPPTISISAPSSTIANASSVVNYTVTYSDANFNSSTLSTSDVTLNQTDTANATVSVDSNSGTTRTVTLSGITANGTLGISIAAGTATDDAGNTAPAAGPSSTVSVDTMAPSVTINQAAGQTDPTISTPISFAVVFSEPVTNFTTGDVSLGGSAGATTATVTGSGSTYDVVVSGMTQSGTVTTTIASGVALDAAANGNSASTSTDNAVSYNSEETVRNSGNIRTVEGGGFDIDYLGNPGQEYMIQYSPDLTPDSWQTLGTAVANSSGIVLIFDNPPTGTTKRFYRMVLP